MTEEDKMKLDGFTYNGPQMSIKCIAVEKNNCEFCSLLPDTEVFARQLNKDTFIAFYAVKNDLYGDKIPYMFEEGVFIPAKYITVGKDYVWKGEEVPPTEQLAGAWHKTDSNDLPEENRLAVGLWAEQAVKCYRQGNEWIDKFHNCYCWTPPTYWTYLPDEKS